MPQFEYSALDVNGKQRKGKLVADTQEQAAAELKRQGLTIAAITTEDVLPSILKKVRFGALDELYAAIGYGGMTAQKSVNRIKEEMTRLGRVKAAEAKAVQMAQESMIPATSSDNKQAQTAKQPKHSESGIVVEGLGNCLIKFAKCCTPVPGDPVVGFITRGFGVSVHRADCPNAIAGCRNPEEKDRWVKVSWVESDQTSYTTALELSGKDRDGLTLDVAMVLSAAKIKVTNLSARSLPDGYAAIFVALEVKDRTELIGLINKLSQVHGIYQVKRTTG